MSFFVTRRHGKYLYRYEVESYWGRAKKQPRQRVLRFLGRVDKQGRVVVPPTVRVDSVHAKLRLRSANFVGSTAGGHSFPGMKARVFGASRPSLRDCSYRSS